MELMPVDKSLELRTTDSLEGDLGELPVKPAERIHSLLRGRYKYAIGLGLGLAVVFGGIGAYLGKVQYQSVAQVRVKPTVPTVMYSSVDPDKQVLPMFNNYVDTQTQLVQSERVLDMAMSSDSWKQTHIGTGPDAVDTVQKNLSVEHTATSFLIDVEYVDTNPAVPQVALQAILDAYRKLYAEADSQNSEKRLEVLNELRDRLNGEYQAAKHDVVAAAQDVGTTDLDKRYDFQLQEFNKYDSTLKDLELQLAMISAMAPTTQSTKPVEMDAQDIAAEDKELEIMLNSQQTLKEQVAMLRQEGYLEEHPKMKAAKAQLDVLTQAISDRVTAYNKKVATGQMAVDTTHNGSSINPLSRLTPTQLRMQRDKVRQLYDQSKKDLLDLGNLRLRIQSLKQDETDVKTKLDAVQNEIDQINVESSITGRIEIDPASEPHIYKKSRPFKFAGLGAFGGLTAGFGLVMLVGLMDRRFRSPADAKMHMHNSPMLGVLPNLPDDLSDPEQAAVTAHYVHQIRTLLQIWDSRRGKQVFSITSPVSGTGKTSLTLALGVSFAAASRTLLIDCDLVGGGLTQRANAIVKRKIGRILQKEGLLTDRQLEDALRLANGSRRRLGEILVELGYLKESELTQALVAQQKANIGLIDAINGENLDDCIAETGIANLYVLSLGGATAQHISRLTPQAIRKLLDQCRERFDTVLIDSGPVPGSLEASAVASEVDGVILCVSRGEQRPLAERCVQHLYSLGARVAGVVFNRARTEDMVLDGTTIRSSQPMSSDAGSMQQSARFGPMARAVASAAVQQENGNGNGNGSEA